MYKYLVQVTVLNYIFRSFVLFEVWRLLLLLYYIFKIHLVTFYFLNIPSRLVTSTSLQFFIFFCVTVSVVRVACFEEQNWQIYMYTHTHTDTSVNRLKTLQYVAFSTEDSVDVKPKLFACFSLLTLIDYILCQPHPKRKRIAIVQAANLIS